MAKVTLLAYTPEPEKLVAAAAKLCYSSSSPQTLMDGLTPEKRKAFWKCSRQSDMKARLSTYPLLLASKGSPVLCWPRSPGIGSPLTVFKASAMSGRRIFSMSPHRKSPLFPKLWNCMSRPWHRLAKVTTAWRLCLSKSIPRRLRPVEWRKSCRPQSGKNGY